MDLREREKNCAYDFLRSSEQALDASEVPAAYYYANSIRQLIDDQTESRIVLGFVGNSGSGKSSVINALMNESQVLPTNSCRACTSVVTEISYNHGSVAYRGEVEIVSETEWTRELENCYNDVINDDTGEGSTVTSEAYAKFKAVYPNLSRERIRMTPFQALMPVLMTPRITELLGEKIDITADKAEDFFDQIKAYIRPTSKPFDDSQDLAEDKTYNCEFWPLISMVKLYLKSEVLRKGVVLVDLPGYGDTNLARVQIAQKYRRKCSAIFLVADVRRVLTDDKTNSVLAEELEQLKLDSCCDELTFICTQIDNIDQKEFLRDNDMTSTSVPALEARIREHDASREKLLETYQKVQDDIYDKEQSRSVVQASEGAQTDGTDTTNVERKRKRGFRHMHSYKTNTGCSQEKIEEYARLYQESGETEVDKETGSLYKQLARIDRRCKRHTKVIADANHQIRKQCIVKRNREICGTFRRRFASQFRKGKKLQIFCVSSTAYKRQLENRQRDVAKCVRPLGFDSKQDTGIPALQAHIQSLAEQVQNFSHDEFMSKISGQYNSLRTWTAPYERVRRCTEEEREGLKDALEIALRNFDQAVMYIHLDLNQALNHQIKELVVSEFDRAIPVAENESMRTVARWHSLEGRNPNTRFRWPPYQATTRRNGCYGKRDFNQDLVAPLIDCLSEKWAEVFSDMIPLAFSSAQAELEVPRQTFLNCLHTILPRHGIDEAEAETLAEQLSIHIKNITQQLTRANKAIAKKQRKIRDKVKLSVQKEMMDHYKECSDIKGSGLSQRIRDVMEQRVDQQRTSMFLNCKEDILRRLEDMTEHVVLNQTRLGRIHESHDKLRQDYLQLCEDPSRKISEAEKCVKEAIRICLKDYDRQKRRARSETLYACSIELLNQPQSSNILVESTSNSRNSTRRSNTPQVARSPNGSKGSNKIEEIFRQNMRSSGIETEDSDRDWADIPFSTLQ